MKQILDERGKKGGFTIVELLTVMSIIVILISLLVPALNRVRRYAVLVKQKAQFHAIGVGLEAFNAENDGYPDSNETDDDTPRRQYCGAMKLAEAMVGQDLKGFNPDSRFRRNGFPGVVNGTPWPCTAAGECMPYPPTGTCGGAADAACYEENLKKRKMSLQLENANAYQLTSFYTNADITAQGFEPNTFVLCDVYNRATNRNTGKKMGMPILYYKAEPTKTKHYYYGPYTPTNPDKNIYDFQDNLRLIDLPIPWDTTLHHPLSQLYPPATEAAAASRFYEKTFNPNLPGSSILATRYPYRADSYILISAGFDGEYGSGDDVFNFGN